MSRATVVFAAVSSIGVATLVHAQAQTPYGPDNGFFRPAPDVALTSPSAMQANIANPAYTPPPYVTLQAPASVAPVPAQVTPAMPAPAPVTPMTAPAPVSPMTAPAPATPMMAPVTQMPTPAAQPPQASAEQQMDRSVAEMDRDRTRMEAAKPGVGAAFDGTTSDANR